MHRMADDWARHYIATHKHKQHERQERQRKETLATAAPPELFQQVRTRMRHDLETFHHAGVLQALRWKENLARKFAITYTSAVLATLEVELETFLMKYQYTCPSQDASSRPYGDSGALRICADVEGVVRIYDSEGGVFADEAEVSEFLFHPLLTYIDG